MPEGDTLFRIAERLRPILVGQTIVRVEGSVSRPEACPASPPLAGHKVTAVEALGKNLLIHFDDERCLHTHLRMSGSWHVYGSGAPWRRPAHRARVALYTPTAVAVCFDAPTVRLLGRGARQRDARLRALGPDLLGETFDFHLATQRLQGFPDKPLGEALLLQAATAGIGNVYKSEVLHLEGLDPFAPVSAFAPQELERVLVTARRLMQRNVAGPPGPGAPLRRVFQKAPDPFAPRRRTTRFDGEGERLWVYGRRGQPCFRCQGTIEMARQGEQLRSTYHCRSCQPPRAAGTPKTAPPCPTVGNCNDI